LRRARPTIRLAAGGPHATLSPTEVAEFVDAVVRDEGEVTFPEVLRAWQAGRALDGIAGVSYRAGGRTLHNPRRSFLGAAGAPEDLALLRNYRRRSRLHHLVRRQLPAGYVTASRGCPFPCTFCYENMIGGTGFRGQPADVFVASVKSKRDRWGTRHFSLADSNFATNPKHARAVLEAVIRADLGCTFSALCRVDIHRHPDILELMRRAGFTGLVLGMESVSDDMLASLIKRQSVQDIVRAIGQIHAHDMTVFGLFMIGFDDDDEDSADRVVEFCESNRVDYLSLYCLTEYPGLPGRTLPRYRVCEPDLDYYTGHFVTTFPLRVRPSALERRVFEALARFYRPAKALELLRRRRLAELMKFAGLNLTVRDMTRVSRRHQAELAAVEEPYYDRHGRLDLDQLRRRPVVREPLRSDVLAGWSDPEAEAAAGLVTLRVAEGAEG
jgi:anaerobic magnesium-protoporphyrin IX monomethyl ester cyclase